MTARPDWVVVLERADRCAQITRVLEVEARELGDIPGSGAGARLGRRVSLLIETFERVCETAAYQVEAERKQAEREARLEQIAAERDQARRATYGS